MKQCNGCGKYDNIGGGPFPCDNCEGTLYDMVPQHTPGSWKYMPEIEDETAYIKGPGTRVICCVDSTDEEDLANGHLIAASPDLLEALESCVELLSGLPTLNGWAGLATLENAKDVVDKTKRDA